MKQSIVFVELSADYGWGARAITARKTMIIKNIDREGVNGYQ